MIGDAQLRALGPDGVLINVGRGPLVQERALYDALAGGVIRAAAIDVWYRYPSGDDVSPPSELPFADLPNLLMTPHSSGVTRDTFTGRVDDIVANIGRLQRGEPLRNVVHGAEHVRLSCPRASRRAGNHRFGQLAAATDPAHQRHPAARSSRRCSWRPSSPAR